MNGAQAMLRTLVDTGVDVCFANPGTSEMHFVAALDDVPEMRAVLGLFEGVVTGAADGYARMSGKPAVTLLHLGPGLGNGLANLHNARRARVPMVNVVGDHALGHKSLDAPLESDIDAVAHTVSGWVRRTTSVDSIVDDTLDAVAAGLATRSVSTLILPADIAWTEGVQSAVREVAASAPEVDEAAVDAVAELLRTSGSTTAILVGADVLNQRGSSALAGLQQATGARVLHETFPRRMTRGAGRFEPDRLQYFGEMAMEQMRGAEHLILVGATEPVAFFAYPDKPGRLVPDDCAVHTLAAPGGGGLGAIEALAERLARDVEVVPSAVTSLERPTGGLDIVTAAAAVAATLPAHAIVSDESATSGVFMQRATLGAAEHDWLALTGGAIGQGMPAATGAAVACPDRPVLNLQADGSAMYTIQSLWTQAREQLDVTTLIFNNGAYAILSMELDRVGASANGAAARSMLDLGRPDLDFCQLAEGQGVPAVRVDTADDLVTELERAYREPGPHLIDALLPR
ncbi:MAG: acetolactate synthase large subunit [Actinomycetota bacterium]